MGFLNNLFGRGTMTEEIKGKETTHMAKDPVCGMTVNEKKAPAKSDYMGKTYYFCSLACKKSFDQNPVKYAGAAGQEMAGHGGHHCCG